MSDLVPFAVALALFGVIVWLVEGRDRRLRISNVTYVLLLEHLRREPDWCACCRTIVQQDIQENMPTIRRRYIASLRRVRRWQGLRRPWTHPGGPPAPPPYVGGRWVQAPSPVGGVRLPDDPTLPAVQPGRKRVHLGRIGMP